MFKYDYVIYSEHETLKTVTLIHTHTHTHIHTHNVYITSTYNRLFHGTPVTLYVLKYTITLNNRQVTRTNYLKRVL